MTDKQLKEETKKNEPKPNKLLDEAALVYFKGVKNKKIEKTPSFYSDEGKINILRDQFSS